MLTARKTYAGTSTACTATACTAVPARIPGTILHEALREAAHSRAVIRIGHPAGVIDTEADVEMSAIARNPGVRRVTLGRIVRRILDGTVYLDDEA